MMGLGSGGVLLYLPAQTEEVLYLVLPRSASALFLPSWPLQDRILTSHSVTGSFRLCLTPTHIRFGIGTYISNLIIYE